MKDQHAAIPQDLNGSIESSNFLRTGVFLLCTGHHLSKHCSRRILETPFPSCWHYCIPALAALSSSFTSLVWGGGVSSSSCCTCSQKNWPTESLWTFLSSCLTMLALQKPPSIPVMLLPRTECERLNGDVPARSPTPLRFLAFNHVPCSPSPVHSLRLYVGAVTWEALRSSVMWRWCTTL